MQNREYALSIENLDITFGQGSVVRNFSATIKPKEILGIVGESGAGKSSVGNAITNLIDAPGKIAQGSILFQGHDLTRLNENAIRKLRGKKIGFIFQDPMSSLNPLLTIEQQLVETIRVHHEITYTDALKKSIELLKEVKIPEAEKRIKQYPFQFSGGMRQRVVIAIALAAEPDFIIADEPTTALDAHIQNSILNLIKNLVKKKNLGALIISHDIGVISEICDNVIIMYRGDVVEQDTVKNILENPQHPYTQGLISSVPRTDYKYHRFPHIESIEQSNQKKQNNSFDYLKSHDSFNTFSIKNISLRFPTNQAFFKKNRSYIYGCRDVNLVINKKDTYGIVGESGSGKSTLAKIICGLYKPDQGEILLDDQTIITSKQQKRKDMKRCLDIQMIFQNPYASLNPRKTVGEMISEPIIFYKIHAKKEAWDLTVKLLEEVGLTQNDLYKYPHEFSGGQKQRISIARTLATKPKIIICDESTSALDVSVQAQILNLLKDLQEDYDLTLIFISHDLPVIWQMCNKVAVMKNGEVVEVAEVDQLFREPQHSYTKELLHLMPKFENLFNYS